MSLKEKEEVAHSESSNSSRDLSEAFAQEAGLRYVNDQEPGFTRKRRGKNFLYFDYQKNRVTRDDLVHRIQSLVIPPAWEDVWICKFKNGHLQATGRDQRVRKQYRYHSLWSQVRNETKFSKLPMFGEALPGLRERLEADLKARAMSREMVLACVIRVMEETMIRIGNDEYASSNDSYGLTTIRNKHVSVKGSTTHFEFRGKSGVPHASDLTDKQLSRIIRRCQELPGQELFGFLDKNGEAHDIGSGDVNSYLKEITGQSITAKDFRTWGATVHAATTLAEMGPLESETKTTRKKREVAVIKSAAEYLRNTPTVCRKYYVHPRILEADLDGSLHEAFKKSRRGRRKDRGLTPEELAVMSLLK